MVREQFSKRVCGTQIKKGWEPLIQIKGTRDYRPRFFGIQTDCLNYLVKDFMDKSTMSGQRRRLFFRTPCADLSGCLFFALQIFESNFNIFSLRPTLHRSVTFGVGISHRSMLCFLQKLNWLTKLSLLTFCKEVFFLNLK